MINTQAVMYKNNVQSNVIIIFIIIFSYQQFVSSLLTPLAFPRNERSQKRFEQDRDEYSMMQYTKFPVAFFSYLLQVYNWHFREKTKLFFNNKLNTKHQCVIL